MINHSPAQLIAELRRLMDMDYERLPGARHVLEEAIAVIRPLAEACQPPDDQELELAPIIPGRNPRSWTITEVRQPGRDHGPDGDATTPGFFTASAPVGSPAPMFVPEMSRCEADDWRGSDFGSCHDSAVGYVRHDGRDRLVCDFHRRHYTRGVDSGAVGDAHEVTTPANHEEQSIASAPRGGGETRPTLEAAMRGLDELSAKMDAMGIVPPCPGCVSENGRVDPDCVHCHGTGLGDTRPEPNHES